MSSDVPVGAGLASTAALCTALVLALAAPPPTGQTLATVAHAVEVTATHVPIGLMDQLASVFGEADAALLIDCREHRGAGAAAAGAGDRRRAQRAPAHASRQHVRHASRRLRTGAPPRAVVAPRRPARPGRRRPAGPPRRLRRGCSRPPPRCAPATPSGWGGCWPPARRASATTSECPRPSWTRSWTRSSRPQSAHAPPHRRRLRRLCRRAGPPRGGAGGPGPGRTRYEAQDRATGPGVPGPPPRAAPGR